ncbi:glyoxalase superfamily protein [Halobacillus salinus]|uniref:Bleomycin resistance protein n=1 Tax=Halobacillus salinus TaxID=192814 RepID=A0A4Z0H3E6_9BACI|nr:glyoxalase superfamily protein [Halobacillus salinus]TGB04404.1 VOC family protein [Halobacillus salinus]
MITPVFRIFDVEKALDFYEAFLGFQVDWTHRFGEEMPEYIQISLQDNVIHLSEHHGDAAPGSTVRVDMKDIKSFHTTLKNKEYHFSNPSLEDTPWGTVEFKVVDPFYNTLIFFEGKEGEG